MLMYPRYPLDQHNFMLPSYRKIYGFYFHSPENQGETVTAYHLKKKKYPLVRAAQVANPDVPEILLE